MSQTALTTREPAAEAISVVERIASKNPADQLQANKALESGDPVYFEALLHILERENRRKRRRFGAAIALAIACTFAIQMLDFLLLHWNVQGVVGGFCIAWGWIAAAFAPTQLQRRAARTVAEYDDIRAVGPLCEALAKQDAATQRLAAAALTRLLPRLKHTDADLLNDRQRDYLLAGFRKGDRNLQLAVLKSLPQIGDVRFLQYVEALAEGTASARYDSAVRSQAAECLDALKTRIDEDKTRLSLLHPIDASNPGADLLLRPTTFSESDSNELLRAAEAL